jgi:hypothetical protein
MALMTPGRQARKNMAYLDQLIREYEIDLALLNEASVAHMRAANAEADERQAHRPFAYSETGTRGRDFWTDKKGVRKPYDRTKWSAAVMAKEGPKLLGEDDVRGRRTPHGGRVIDIPFANSRPGTWIAATVKSRDQSIASISLYGLIEELTDASMHRSLSEISPIFGDPAHRELVLLGGDFNIGTGLADPSARRRSKIVLDRIEAYGLVDCLATWREKRDLPGIPGCSCGDDPCRHTVTRVAPTQKPGVPWEKRNPVQVDYLFATETLAEELDDVVELPPEEWEMYSDHRPIIARFKS